MSIGKFFQKAFGRKPKQQPLSPDQIRQAKRDVIETHFGCPGAFREIADNDRIDKLIADVQSQDVLRQQRALRILGISETKGYLFDGGLISELRQIDQQK